ncbi:glycine betaine/proline transport system substrate-binding protein [Anaerovirgula multivorans]|uniref:Glycine betaine/proline transport system substrate-binding protein n=1 Tax=Anaerovirgula multivorans TaxID=312168 RepID=A0A239BU40_9FIRM|nr:glycine betaine ABC transporter substrate-binding protein [Anaerovirgula multivorans]SNS11142.1 glycine betaine/proline transport system substrate-binding protein [Anaerovirgula multivorans]
MIVRKKLVLGVIMIILSLAVAGCGGESEEQAPTDEKPTIAIGEVPYPHEWVPANIIKHVAEELGYSTEMVEGDIGFMFLGLAQGDIHIFPDVWLPTLHKTYIDRYEDQIQLTGILYENIDMGWAVPSYVDIDSIDQLKDRADEFNNRIIGIEPSAGMMVTSMETIEAYGLDEFELLEGSTPAMLAEVEKAIQQEEPIVFLAWRPHTMFTRYDIKLLEDPEGIWVLDDAITGVYPELEEIAPDLYEFVQNFEIDIQEIEGMLEEMELNDRDIEELTKEWIEENRDKVDAMLGN